MLNLRDIQEKEGARRKHHDNSVSLTEWKTVIRALMMPTVQRGDPQLLIYEQQVVSKDITDWIVIDQKLWS